MTQTWTKAFQNLLHLDRLSLRWVAQRRTPWLDLTMQGFTRAGDWESWTFLILLGLAYGDLPRQLALRITPKLLLTLGICYAIKKISKRKRPSAAMHDFYSLLKNPDPYSFPSSHTACAWVVCASLGLLLGWGWPLWIAHAAAISYSRIHVGAHYPLDVAMGAGIGLSIAVFL